jgi:hypothetical protein
MKVVSKTLEAFESNQCGVWKRSNPLVKTKMVTELPWLAGAKIIFAEIIKLCAKQEEQVAKFSDAYRVAQTETEIYFSMLEETEDRDRAKEQEIARLWSKASYEARKHKVISDKCTKFSRYFTRKVRSGEKQTFRREDIMQEVEDTFQEARDEGIGEE